MRVHHANHAVVAASEAASEVDNAADAKNGSPDRKRVLVVGSSGYIGKFVVRT